MSKTATEPEIVKREIGEHVEVACHFEQSTVKELGDGVFEAIITTSEVDRHNENIETDGIDTENWEKNSPAVLYGHDYWDRLPIGKGLSLTRYKNKLKSKFQLAIEEYDFADTVARLIKGGYLTAVSIGGIVKEWSDDYRTIIKMEMVEFSVVPIPANRSALITGKSLQDMTGKSLSDIRREYRDLSHKYMLDKLKGVPHDEVSSAIKVLKNLIATLEESHKATSSADAEPETVKRIKRIRVMDSAKAVNKESERVIRILKLKKP
jgi:HK97 family phage prohead protease